MTGLKIIEVIFSDSTINEKENSKDSCRHRTTISKRTKSRNPV